MRTLFSQQQWIDMKVLVTGATSGLGRNAVEFLCQKGISVRATGRNEAMGKLLEKMGAEFVPADLTELVSSQAKVMLAALIRCGTAPALPRPGGHNRLSIWLTFVPLAAWVNGLLPGVCVTLFISLLPPCTSIITTIAILKKIFALTASPTSLPAAKQPVKK